MQLTVKTDQHFCRQEMLMKGFLFFLHLNPPGNHFIEGIYHAVPSGRGGDEEFRHQVC